MQRSCWIFFALLPCLNADGEYTWKSLKMIAQSQLKNKCGVEVQQPCGNLVCSVSKKACCRCRTPSSSPSCHRNPLAYNSIQVSEQTTSYSTCLVVSCSFVSSSSSSSFMDWLKTLATILIIVGKREEGYTLREEEYTQSQYSKQPSPPPLPQTHLPYPPVQSLYSWSTRDAWATNCWTNWSLFIILTLSLRELGSSNSSISSVDQRFFAIVLL